MRFVMEPTVSFDVFWASEDLTEASGELLGSSGGGPDPPTVSPYPVEMDFPDFDAQDFPMRDAQILAFRLDSRLQAKTGDLRRDLLVHSLTISHDFEPDHDGTDNLESEVYVALWGDWKLHNFLDVNMRDEFLQHTTTRLSGSIFDRVHLGVDYSRRQPYEDWDAQDYMGGDVSVRLQKYTCGFRIRRDLDANTNTSTVFSVQRDLHDAMVRLDFRIRDREYGEDDFEVRLRFQFIPSGNRADRSEH
jgi:hypothetical protein